MRVTFVMTSFPRLPIGGYRVVYEYANNLARRGHEVSVVHCRSVKGLPGPGNLYRHLRTYLGYYWRQLTKARPGWHAVDERVRMLFAPCPDQKYIPDGDAVFATAWVLSDYVLGYGETKGRKCYLFQHYETWSGPKEKVDETWRAPFHKVVISKWLSEIGASLGAERVTYIPNGIDHDIFRLYEPIEGRPAIVSMMCSNQAWKGSADGFKALKLAKERIPDLRVIVFGVTRYDPGIPGWMDFHENPAQEELVRRIYNKSSVFLWPSHFEGFSLPPAEAMACGCAVVSTDCGGISDFTEDRVSALVSEPGKPELLAENLVRVLKDETLRGNLASRGNENIRALTWKRSTDLMEDFLKGCLNEKRG